jgi:hypothetical protein
VYPNTAKCGIGEIWGCNEVEESGEPRASSFEPFNPGHFSLLRVKSDLLSISEIQRPELKTQVSK